jgi:hypothetical protein
MPTWISPNWVATSFREALFEQYVITDLSILNPTERETPVTISFFTEIGTLLESYSGTWLVGPRSCLVHKAEEPDGVDTFGTGWVEITAPVSIVPAGRVRATWRRVSEAPPRSQTLVATTRVMVFYEKQEPMVPSILSSLMRVEERWLSADWRAFESRSPERRVVGDTTVTLVHFVGRSVDIDINFFDRSGMRIDEYSGRWTVPSHRAFAVTLDSRRRSATAEGFGWFEIRSTSPIYPTATLRLGQMTLAGEGGAWDTVLLERRSRLVWRWDYPGEPPGGGPPSVPVPPTVPGSGGTVDPGRPPLP